MSPTISFLSSLFCLALIAHQNGGVPLIGKGVALEGLGPRTFCRPGHTARPPGRVNSTTQVKLVRETMAYAQSGWPELKALIVTTDDEHQTEFVHERDNLVKWVSGYTGSLGLAVITIDNALLWVDGRYEAQADEQLDCQWTVLHTSSSDTPTASQWLATVLPPGSRVGADPRRVPNYIWMDWKRTLESRGILLSETTNNIIEYLWGTKRPKYSKTTSFALEIKYTGMSWEEKVKNLREELKDLNADAMVVTALDEIAWLLNIRGMGYYPYNPFIRAYVLVTSSEVTLYVEKNTIRNSTIYKSLRMDGCTVGNLECVKERDYYKIFNDLRTRSQAWRSVLLPTSWSFSKGASHKIVESVPQDLRLQQRSPIILPKSIKNEVEIKGMKEAHVTDAVAMCEFLYKIENQIFKSEWSELNITAELNLRRRSQFHNRGLSFATIAGYGPNGALPHYVPTNMTNRIITNTSTLVLDSGGHYFEGTTDVTRTLHFGEPTDFQREAYTRVLQGQINMAMAIFPENIQISQLETLARGPLWNIGLNYRHGTGHGIGAYNTVHESPLHIWPTETETLYPGQFLSNEPGYYQEKQFGVRLENILLVEKSDTKYDFDGPYLGFQTVTLVPYERKLIKFELLTVPQIRWLNDYNNQIREQVGRELKRRKLTKEYRWLLEKTKYIPEKSSSGSLASRSQFILGLTVAVVCSFLL